MELEGELPAAAASRLNGQERMERRIRLRHAADFARMRQASRSWSDRLVVLVARPNELHLTRIGIIASRKLGKAAARNRARRLLREAARRLHPCLAPGWDLLFIARPDILEVKEPQVESALAKLASQAGLMAEEHTQ